MRKSTLAVAAAAAITVALPASAHAANVYTSYGSNAYYQAAPGEKNQVTVTTDANHNVIITDTGATITATDDPGSEYKCTVTGHVATCPSYDGYQSGANLSLGDGDDSLVDGSDFAYPCYDEPKATCHSEVDAFGGPGADRLTGSATDEDLNGGAGADVLTGNGGDDTLRGDDDDDADYPESSGADTLSGGDGDDRLAGGPGADSIDGGAGTDDLSYDLYPTRVGGTLVYPKTGAPGVTVTLNRAAATTGNGAAGENDTVAGVENLYGTRGTDTLTGSDAANVIYGFSADDTITGGGGYDRLFGEGGADAIDARDNGPDTVDCGGAEQPGSVAGDDVDQLSNCAAGNAALTAVATPAPVQVQVQVPVPVPVPVADTKPATLSQVSVPSSFKLAKLKSSGTVPVTFTASEAGSAEVDLTAKAKSARIAKAGDLVLAAATTSVQAAKQTTVKLKLSRKIRKGLRKRRKLTLRLAFTDKGGNVTSTSRKIRLK